MLHVRPSKDLRSNYTKISELVKNGDRVVITVNGVGDGVFICMDDFNEYERLRKEPLLMTAHEQAEVARVLKESTEYNTNPKANIFTRFLMWISTSDET